MPKQKPERFELILGRYGFVPLPKMKLQVSYSWAHEKNVGDQWTPFMHPSNGCLILVNKEGTYGSHNDTRYFSSDTLPYTQPNRYHRFQSGRQLECWCWYEFVRGKDKPCVSNAPPTQ